MKIILQIIRLKIISENQNSVACPKPLFLNILSSLSLSS
jgi:hypothetical protein